MPARPARRSIPEERGHMRHSDLVVLGLLAAGPQHGYELTNQLEAMQVRRWARISPATVYRRLDRLAERGLLAVRTEREGDRPEREVHELTAEGRETLAEQVEKALRSEEPAYSDRVVGAVFALAGLAPDEREEALLSAAERREAETDALAEEIEAGSSAAGEAVLRFYRTVARAEAELLRTLAGG